MGSYNEPVGGFNQPNLKNIVGQIGFPFPTNRERKMCENDKHGFFVATLSPPKINTHLAVLDPEKKSLNGLFSLLNR